jgi:hypothetical protein
VISNQRGEKMARSKSELTSTEVRFFNDATRILAWSIVDEFDPDMTLEIAPVDIPGGKPGSRFVAVQDSVNSLKLTRHLFIQAKNMGKVIIFHRIEINTEPLCSAIPDQNETHGTVYDYNYMKAIRALPINEMPGDINSGLKSLLDRDGCLPESGLSLSDQFYKDPDTVGNALWNCASGLQMIVWRAPINRKDPEQAPFASARAVAIRDIYNSVREVEHLVSGAGVRDIEWTIKPGLDSN